MGDRTLDFPPFSGARDVLASRRLRALFAAALDRVRRGGRAGANRRAAQAFVRLDDGQLRDLGLTRAEIRAAAAEGRLLR